MGLFWDLMQQSQIRDQQRTAETLEDRVSVLEREVHETRKTLHDLVALLEKRFGEDIDKNGRIG